MTIAEQLEHLQDRIIDGSLSATDAAQELRGLLHCFDRVLGGGPYRDRINHAINWAVIYAKLRKPNRYDQVRQSLLQDISAAARWAKRLEGSTSYERR